MTIGHPAKSVCPLLYAILSAEESNRRFSVYTLSDRSIGHTLVAWQSGILQNQCARFCVQSYPWKGFHFLSVRVAMPLNGPVSSTQ